MSTRPGAARVLPWLAAGSVWALDALTTWGRWGDIVTDCGRDLDTALQLSEGRRLYSEVRYWYGPLPPYLNAGLFRLFGAHVDTLAAAGLLAGGLLAVLAYRTARLFCGRLAATALAVAVLQVNVFVQLYPNNIFNFVMPYATAATYGMVLAAASVFFLLRHVCAARAQDLWLSTLLLGLTGLCKLEPLFAAGLAHLAFLAGLAVADRGRLRPALPPYAAAVLPVAAVFGFFRARTGPELWGDNLFLASNVTAGNYALQHSGLLDLGPSLAALLVSLAGLLACAACAYAAERARKAEATMIAGLVAGAIVASLGPLRTFRALPVLMAAAIVLAIRRRRSGAPLPECLAAVVLWSFALGGLARIVLRAGAEHYGFYLLVPGVVAFAVLWCREVPGLLGGDGRGPAAMVGAAMLAAAAASHAVNTWTTAHKTYGGASPVVAGTRRGSLPLPVPYAGTIDEATRFLETLPPDRRVVVVPQGVGITFVSGLHNALGIHTFLPLDFGGRYGEANVVKDLQARPPDVVVVVSADTREYGKEGFGIDYGLEVAGWIGARYAVDQSWRSPYYAVQVLTPRAAPAPPPAPPPAP
jgi:hypothetical protein